MNDGVSKIVACLLRYIMVTRRGLKSLRSSLSLKRDYVQSSLIPNAYIDQSDERKNYFGTRSCVRANLVSV